MDEGLKALTKDLLKHNENKFNDVLKRWIDLEHKVDWVKCPLCKEEWIKLMPSCGLCIDCGRDVRGILRVIKNWPFKENAVVGVKLQKWARSVAKEDRTPDMYFATISYQDKLAVISVEIKYDFPICVSFGKDQDRRFENLPKAWMVIKKFFDGGLQSKMLDEMEQDIKKQSKWD